ncbi:MAG: hypothetical protein OEW30_21130 [Acidimicrobiia bacterium]|nr:hypothetical protein [Acidimicrobiia bacterium]
MRNRIAVVGLALVLALTACSSGDDGDTGTTGSSTPTTTGAEN